MKTVWNYVREGRYYILVLLALTGVSLWAIRFIDSPIGGARTPVLVVVEKGATAETIGALLADKGLIRFSWSFPLISRTTGEAREIKPGAYKLDRGMRIRQMLEKMVRGQIAAVWVTIPEGYTIGQIADRLADKGVADKGEFLMLAENRVQEFGKILDIPGPSLEGYLFPDTYLVPLDSDTKSIVELMLEDFKSKVAQRYSKDIERVSADGSSTSRAAALHRIVTVASMVEREAKVPKDRPLVSAVIWNRLRIGMKLDIDATVQYALGRHRSRLFYRDLEVDSPYNTYLRAGLPPGPISNPGLSSIEAALHPAGADYLYYVARPDGSHVFSRTEDEHNAAKRRIRSGQL